jgi:hypothetical protein
MMKASHCAIKRCLNSSIRGERKCIGSLWISIWIPQKVNVYSVKLCTFLIDFWYFIPKRQCSLCWILCCINYSIYCECDKINFHNLLLLLLLFNNSMNEAWHLQVWVIVVESATKKTQIRSSRKLFRSFIFYFIVKELAQTWHKL